MIKQSSFCKKAVLKLPHRRVCYEPKGKNTSQVTAFRRTYNFTCTFY